MTPQDLGRKWVPKDAAALLEAFNAGLLEETRWLDLKREPTSNRESAKDMAAFSIDGGTIVIGIDEKKPNGDPLNPVVLKGLPEKLEQIAAMLIEPPLQISCTTVESGDDDGRGYVLVHIPASPLAPHQVAGTYYARRDKTTARMSESDVERLYQRRAQWNRDIGEMLGVQMGAFPRFETLHLPVLFAVARPVAGWPDMCQDLVSGTNWRGKIDTLKFNVGRDELFGFCSELGYTFKSDRGALLASQADPASTDPDRITRLLEIGEDGELRLFYNAPAHSFNVNSTPRTGLRLWEPVSITRELLAVARHLSDRCGHVAAWDFGLALDSMRGVRPMADPSYPFYPHDHPGYPGNDYRSTTRANVLELQKAPGAVAERLVGRLFRNFDVSDEKLLAVFADETDE